MEKGSLSIHSENIMPIIKKWLYSDTDIFLRELISNAVDAITKLKKMSEFGEIDSIPDDENYSVKVLVDKQNKQIIFEDNGIGMTADEIREYINQIAFSGATSFLEKYKDQSDSSNEIIGHFGLGFYSSFMVSDKVRIDSLSYKPDSAAAGWECDGGTEYTMGESGKTTRGTTITLFVNDESAEFLEVWKIRSILIKYCGFVSVPIYLEEIKPADATTDSTIDQSENKTVE